MSDIFALFQNYVLHSALIAWLSAQVLKTLITFLLSGKLQMERMFGAGGMPSAHSACVCALVIAITRKLGFGSPEFAIAFVVAAVVMYDATGVRRAAGEHAKVLNKLVEEQREEQRSDDVEELPEWEDQKELKEFLGHTPLEVLAGALLGILVAMMMPLY